jgi:hypothetical protein
MKVGFLIAGVQKGGTTSLDSYLRQHPAIGMARRKEVHFFDDEKAFGQGTPSYDPYHAEFDTQNDVVIRGEATPIYTYWSEAPRRIWDYNARMRIIVLLRNPIERAWSHWKMTRKLGAEELDFSEAIRTETERCRAALPFQHAMFSYVDRGFYSEQIRRLRRFFPEEQLLFIKSEDFFRDAQSALHGICRFLSVGEMEFDVQEALNASPGYGAMQEADQEFLRDRFELDIRQTEALLDWQCADWLG